VIAAAGYEQQMTRRRATRAWLPVALLGLLAGSVLALPGMAAADDVPPQITGMSASSDVTPGGLQIQIVGANFTDVRGVLFGTHKATDVDVRGSSVLAVTVLAHKAGWVMVRVVTSSGTSQDAAEAKFRYAPLSFAGTKLNGGWTAGQEAAIAARFRATAAARRAVPKAARAPYWTSAMGQTAVRLAERWKGLPYSFDGGTAAGPSAGVCDSNVRGQWFDCRVWGFDCSGLVLYSWAPYVGLVHYAATQYLQAGRFHPSVDSLQPGDLLFYSTGGVRGIHHVAMYVGKGRVIQAGLQGYPVQEIPIDEALGGDYYGATRPMSTGKQAAAASVSRIEGSQGATTGGTTITIRGNHFSSASVVIFGGVRTYDFTVFSQHAIQVKVPSQAAGAVTVKVSNAWGTSRPVPTAVYTYADPAAPASPLARP
jgi:cell wall-associated NlpC family hydrolase